MKGSALVLLAGVLTAGLVASDIVRAQAPTPAPGQGKKDVAGITNFTQLDSTIACAGATKASAVPELKKMGFKSIVNLRYATEEGADVEGEKAAAEAAGLQYYHLPFTTPQKPEEDVSATVEEFLRVTSSPSSRPVFVHCGGGGRASAMWLIKRVVNDGWDIEKAKAEALLVSPGGRSVEWAVAYAQARKAKGQ